VVRRLAQVQPQEPQLLLVSAWVSVRLAVLVQPLLLVLALAQLPALV